MGAINPQVFSQHSDAKLRVWFSDGVNGFQQLSPDRPFASVPYAFSAGTAQSATLDDRRMAQSISRCSGSDVLSACECPYWIEPLILGGSSPCIQIGSEWIRPLSELTLVLLAQVV